MNSDSQDSSRNSRSGSIISTSSYPRRSLTISETISVDSFLSENSADYSDPMTESTIDSTDTDIEDNNTYQKIENQIQIFQNIWKHMGDSDPVASKIIGKKWAETCVELISQNTNINKTVMLLITDFKILLESPNPTTRRAVSNAIVSLYDIDVGNESPSFPKDHELKRYARSYWKLSKRSKLRLVIPMIILSDLFQSLFSYIDDSDEYVQQCLVKCIKYGMKQNKKVLKTLAPKVLTSFCQLSNSPHNQIRRNSAKVLSRLVSWGEDYVKHLSETKFITGLMNNDDPKVTIIMFEGLIKTARGFKLMSSHIFPLFQRIKEEKDLTSLTKLLISLSDYGHSRTTIENKIIKPLLKTLDSDDKLRRKSAGKIIGHLSEELSDFRNVVKDLINFLRTHDDGTIDGALRAVVVLSRRFSSSSVVIHNGGLDLLPYFIKWFNYSKGRRICKTVGLLLDLWSSQYPHLLVPFLTKQFVIQHLVSFIFTSVAERENLLRERKNSISTSSTSSSSSSSSTPLSSSTTTTPTSNIRLSEKELFPQNFDQWSVPLNIDESSNYSGFSSVWKRAPQEAVSAAASLASCTNEFDIIPLLIKERTTEAISLILQSIVISLVEKRSYLSNKANVYISRLLNALKRISLFLHSKYDSSPPPTPIRSNSFDETIVENDQSKIDDMKYSSFSCSSFDKRNEFWSHVNCNFLESVIPLTPQFKEAHHIIVTLIQTEWGQNEVIKRITKSRTWDKLGIDHELWSNLKRGKGARAVSSSVKASYFAPKIIAKIFAQSQGPSEALVSFLSEKYQLLNDLNQEPVNQVNESHREGKPSTTTKQFSTLHLLGENRRTTKHEAELIFVQNCLNELKSRLERIKSKRVS